MTTSLSRPLRDATWSERNSVFTVFFVLGLGTGAWAASLPAFKERLGLSDRDLGVALFALAAGSIASTVVTAAVAPRIGTRRATTIGTLCFILALALPPLAGSMAAFVVAALGVGFGMGLLDVSMNGHASALEGRWGSPVMSSLHGGFSLGGLAGAALGGTLAAAGWGPGGQLWTAALLGAALDVLALPALGPGAAAAPKRGTGLGLALPSRTLVGLGIVASFCFVVEGAMGDWSAVFLATVAGSGMAAAAAGYAAFSIAMAAVRFAGDRGVAAVGPRRILFGGGLLAACGVTLAVAWPDPVVASFGFAMVGLGLGNVAPVAFSAAARLGSTPAAGVAPVATVGYAGMLLGPPVIGFLAGAMGLRGALGCLVLVALVVAVVGHRVAGHATSD